MYSKADVHLNDLKNLWRTVISVIDSKITFERYNPLKRFIHWIETSLELFSFSLVLNTYLAWEVLCLKEK